MGKRPKGNKNYIPDTQGVSITLISGSLKNKKQAYSCDSLEKDTREKVFCVEKQNCSLHEAYSEFAEVCIHIPELLTALFERWQESK